MFITTVPSPIGNFHACADDHGLCRLLFPGRSMVELSGQFQEIQYHDRLIFRHLFEQLNEYLEKKRRIFDLPLSIQGTDFQRSVWELLGKIPYGQTSTYGDLAEKLGSRNKARPVGGAAHVNPLPIIIPCHRLIGAGGNLTGFAGGLKIKKYLLALEGSTAQGRETNGNRQNNR